MIPDHFGLHTRMELYVIRFADGSYSNGTYWSSSETLVGAKVYTKVAHARGSMTQHKDSWASKAPRIVVLTVTQTRDLE